MKSVVIIDRETNKVVKKIKIPDEVVKIINDVGGLSMDNYFSWEIK